MTDEPTPLPSAKFAPPRRASARRKKERLEPRIAPAEAVSRPAMRAEDPREAAAKRAAEILGNFDGTEMQGDEFVAPPAPPGWCYEWKVLTVMNQEDPGRMMGYRRTGWNEVPYARHPEMMPIGYKGTTIERKGMVLMERPQEITDRFKERDRQAARAQVRTKEEQLSQAAPGQFERSNKDAPLSRVKKGFEPMEIPGDK